MIRAERMRASLLLVSLSLLACGAAPLEAPPTPRAARAATALPERTAAVDATTPARSGERTGAFVAGYAAMRAGRSEEARRYFAESVGVLPELADHALYHQGHLALQANDREAARAAIDRLLAEHPDSVWRAAAAVDRGRIALDDGAPAVAASWFERALAAPRVESSVAAAARLGLAESRIALGDEAAAYDLLDELRARSDEIGSRARALAASLESGGAARLGMSRDELVLTIARARLREGQPEAARRELAPLLRPGHPRRGEAALLVARSFGKSSPEEADRAYETAIVDSSSPDVAGTALYERARAAWNRNDDADADRDFETLLARFPAHPEAPEALYARARIAEARGDAQGAASLYERVAARYPAAPEAEESAWRAGFVRYRAGDFAGAARAFAALGDDEEAVYWHGRALEEDGKPEAGQALLESVRERSPSGYLAWWVDERVGPAEDVPAPGDPGRLDLAQTTPALGEIAAYHYGRGRLLASLDLRADAVREYAAVEGATGPRRFLLPAYDEVDANGELIRLAIRLKQAGDPGVTHYLYPRPYADAFSRGAVAAGVDPLLLVAMARQESLFEPAALSPAGARGVLQLMPATAARLAGGPVDATILNDPAANIALGARYLGGLMHRYDGRIVLAVAAYNGGPEAVDRWLERAPGAAGDEFVERISYRETRDYVKAVLRNYRTYHLLYGDGALPQPELY